MKKFSFQAIGLLILIIGGLLLVKNPDFLTTLTGSNVKYPTTRIQIKDAVINGEIADSDSEQSKGLSGRENLASNSGMLFVYKTQGVRRFWMKGMKFPIDIVWIKNGSVVDVLLDAKPPQPNTPDSKLTVYQPNESVDQVLEVNSGFVNANGISIGDNVKIETK